MAFPPVHFPPVDWANDWAWVGYKTDGARPAPSPHTWQDWTVTGLMFVVAAAFLVLIWLCFLWREGSLNFPRRALGCDKRACVHSAI